MSGSYREFYRLAASGKNPERLKDYLGHQGHRIINEFFADIYPFNIDRPDKNGKTALFLAVENGQLAAVEALIKAGAHVNYICADNMTPLLIATKKYYPAITKALIEAGGAVDIHDSFYNYPLHWAAWHGDTDAIALLLDKGAAIDIQDKINGETPLHRAVQANRISAVSLLAERGANKGLCNRKGHTVAHLASADNLSHLLPLLLPAKPSSPPAASPPALATTAADSRIWTRIGGMKIASVERSDTLRRTLTEIFNFESRERILISHNTRHDSENMSAPVRFETLHPAAVAKALAEFIKQGGVPDDDLVKTYTPEFTGRDKSPPASGSFRL